MNLCGTVPLPFVDRENIIALHGLPTAKEMVMILWNGRDSRNPNSGVLLRITNERGSVDYDQAIRYKVNNLDTLGIF